MREKQVILESSHSNALKAGGPAEISLIHQLHTLEVLIDIRDILEIVMEQNQDHWDELMPKKEATPDDTD